MQLPDSIRENLRFLRVEVDSQLASLQSHFTNPSPALARRILDRSGYAYNLKIRIHTSCVNQLACGKQGSNAALVLRSVEFIATDLERITEFCRLCVQQMSHLSDHGCLHAQTYTGMLKRVRGGINMVEPAILDNNTRLALQIGQIEARLERDYGKLLKRYTRALKRQKNTEDLTHAMFVAHSVEQMGAALLNIGESILSANLGQAVNFERYHSLQASIEQLDFDEPLPDLLIEPIAQTRSGSAISGIASQDRGNGEEDYVAVFKEGRKRKLKEERQGVENWHEIYPGLAPKILSYKKRGQSAALLIEHLSGLTFEQIILKESPSLQKEGLRQLQRTLKSVWRATRTGKPVSARYMQQLEKRLSDVYKIHPEFKQGQSRICNLSLASFDSLVQQANRLETKLTAPFSVYIHGDFNVDNIIYDPMEQRINFIDLHRSRYMDYVQDVSVFMVSNYRLQILDAPVRRRIMQLAQDFYYFARSYARKHGDEGFELRLALGLARSFVTSTRFILDKSLARRMFLRARFLLERVLESDLKKAGDFKIPIQEIFID